MRANTSWAFAGDAVYAGCQWVVLVLLIKALSPAHVGVYAYALAITSPIFVLASVRLRNLLVTTGAPTHDFRDYLTTRLVTTSCALIASLAVGALSTPTREALIVVALVALARSCDAVSDICHGLFQHALDMRTAALGLMLNGALSVLLVQGALVLWHSLPLAAVAYAVGSAVPLFAWNLPNVAGMLKSRSETSDLRNNWSHVRSLLVRALPLGLSSAVGSTQTNLPRYAIAALLGPAPLAVFAAISHIPLLGHLVVNAATQSALPLLADDARTRRSSHQARLYGLVAMSVGFGSLALLLTIVLGRRVLGVIYGPEYADHAGVLVWLMATAVVTFASVFLGAGTTARGRFGAQLTISTVSFAFVAVSIGPLVQRFGLIGAAWALLIGAIVELCAYAVLTAHDLRRGEANPTLVPGALSGSGAATPQRTKPIRVLHVFGCLDRGGAEMRAIELAEYFAGDRVHSDFVALTGRDGALDERVRAAGGEVIKCPLDRRFTLAFYRLLKRGRYDVVHSHVHYSSGVILSIARAAGVPGRVAHLHTAVVNGRRNTLARRTQLAICRGLLRRNATDIVACGEGTMQVAWGPDWAADPRCRVIYFGVRADRVRSAFRERTSTPTVVNVASVQPLKNQARLIDVMRRLVKRVPGVELRLVGRELGDYGRKVRRAAADAGLADRISLMGEVSEPMPLMASAHLMVLPSLWEGVPCAALEACALGTPVLASDLPGTRELARHFPHLHLMSLHEDDEAWASAAERLINMRAPAFADAAERLAGTPFAFDRSCEAHYEVWSRPHV